jgi:hypothetical protein
MTSLFAVTPFFEKKKTFFGGEKRRKKKENKRKSCPEGLGRFSPPWV